MYGGDDEVFLLVWGLLEFSSTGAQWWGGGSRGRVCGPERRLSSFYFYSFVECLSV